MSGAVLEICPKRNFYFSRIAGSGSYSHIIPVAERIDVSSWSEVVLMVRVHSVSIADASDFIEIGIAADGYTPESPDTDFQVSGGLATVTLGSTASAPSYHYVSAGSAFGPLVRIAVTGTRGGASSTSDLEADLSLALSMKAPGQGR